MSTSRTFVLAENQVVARRWCDANGIQPHARTTVLLGPRTGRGHLIRQEDRVVFVGDVQRRQDYRACLYALVPALVQVGGMEKVEWL